jgi:nitrite reductase/ring-hydroxylating ferredoxin subunit
VAGASNKAGRRRRARFRICASAELGAGESRKFLLTIAGIEEECFLINLDGEFHAFVNRCRHVPLPLDWVDNQFFTADRRYLMCQTHGALYLPASGLCVSGPGEACGKKLFRIPLEIADGQIYAQPPASAPERGI